jgi:hypothetical protein
VIARFLSLKKAPLAGLFLCFSLNGWTAPRCADLAAPPADETTRRIVAVVSPAMPYALTEWPRLHQLAQQAGFEVDLRFDARTPPLQWQSAAKAALWPAELLATAKPCVSQQLFNHFPHVWVQGAGQTDPSPILGVMPDEAWQKALWLKASQLKKTSAVALTQASLPAPAPKASSSAEKPKPGACIPAVEYIPLPGPSPYAELGAYERISPDGRFILRSYSGAQVGQVALVEINGQAGQRQITVHKTPLSNEAFPVQGSWRYLVDVNGEHYRFADVLRDGARAKPRFKGGMTGFYAAAAEVSSKPVRIRSLSWPVGEDAATGQIGQGPLQLRTIELNEQEKISADTGGQFICTQRAASDGNLYTLPMLSADGQRFSAVPLNPKDAKPSMRVYELNTDAMANTHSCERSFDLGAAPGKAVFSASGQELTYTDNGLVHVINAQTGGAIPIDDLHPPTVASAFAGFTDDGRVIFAATWKRCAAGQCREEAGYVIADPAQQSTAKSATPGSTTCITEEAVRVQRQRFAEQRGLPK